jgi:hypothetical protein
VTDGNIFIAFFHVLFIGKKHDLSKKKFKIFGVKPILSVFHMWKVKRQVT